MKTNDKLTLIGIVAIVIGIPLGFIGGYLAETYELPTWISVLNAFVLITLFCVAAFAHWRSAELDELQSLIRMRALAMSAVIMFAALMIFWTLYTCDLLSGELNMNVVLFIMMISYGAGQVIANWKYRMVEEKNESVADGS